MNVFFFLAASLRRPLERALSALNFSIFEPQKERDVWRFGTGKGYMPDSVIGNRLLPGKPTAMRKPHTFVEG